MKKFKALFAVAALVAAAFVPSSASAAPLVVPTTAFKACDATYVTFCVESVAIQSAGMAKPETLIWVKSGDAVPGEVAAEPTASPSPSASASPAATPEPGATTPATPGATVPGKALAGRWTSATWATDGRNEFGYDGLYVDMKAANAFTSQMFFNVVPVKSTANVANQANQADNSAYAAGLNPNDVITFKVRVGAAIAGVTVGIGKSVSTTKGTDANGNTLVITGVPVPVAVAGRSGDCEGEAGVAVANMNQLQGLIVVENDGIGFGVDGVSGDLAVSSNGSCNLSTPVWNESTKSLSWTAASPHFAKDGTTVNTGFYTASIPVADAALLWGLTNPKDAATALTLQVTTEAGGTVNTAISKVTVKNNKIIIDATGFHFSKPIFKIKANPKYKKFVKAKTLLKCVNVKTKKVKSFKGYVCPSGTKLYKK